jgi:hypothetical protein
VADERGALLAALSASDLRALQPAEFGLLALPLGARGAARPGCARATERGGVPLRALGAAAAL